MNRFMKGTKKRQWRRLPVLLLSITLLASQSSLSAFAMELDSAEYMAMQYSAQEETEHSAEAETITVQDTGPETEEGLADELPSDESEVDSEFAAWMKQGFVTEQMIARAKAAKSLDSLVLENNSLVYVRTGEIIAELNRETGALTDAGGRKRK